MLPFCLREEAAPCARRAPGQGEWRRQVPAAGSHRHAKAFGHVQLPPSALTLAPLEGTGKANPGEEPAITGLSKRPPWKNGVVSCLSPLPATHAPSPLPLCPPHPPQVCWRIPFYTSCSSMSRLIDVHSPSGPMKVSSKWQSCARCAPFCPEQHFHSSGMLQAEHQPKRKSTDVVQAPRKKTPDSDVEWMGINIVCRFWGRQRVAEDQQLEWKKAKKTRRGKWGTHRFGGWQDHEEKSMQGE